MTTAAISRDDLDGMLRTHRGEAALQAALDTAREPEALLSVLGRYVQFNSAFGPGVANLAGEIARPPGPVPDPQEPVRLLSDRAARGGLRLLLRGDRRVRRPADALARHAPHAGPGHAEGRRHPPGLPPQRPRPAGGAGRAHARSLRRVWEGYGVGTKLDDRSLFRGMGFHTGSEVLADQEFTLIDRHLRERRADMVRALEATKIELQGQKHDAYYWIRIHTGVEAEHFDAALAGANKALGYYAGADDAGAAEALDPGGRGRVRGRAGRVHAASRAGHGRTRRLSRNATLPPRGWRGGSSPAPASPARGSACVFLMSSVRCMRQVDLHLVHHRPGPAERMWIVSARYTASAMSWVTKRMVPGSPPTAR